MATETKTYTVRYEGRIPKTLRAYAEKHAHQIVEVTFDTLAIGEYDVLLRDGWRKIDDIVHQLVDPTVKGLIGQLRGIVPCDCSEDCRKAQEAKL